MIFIKEYERLCYYSINIQSGKRTLHKFAEWNKRFKSIDLFPSTCKLLHRIPILYGFGQCLLTVQQVAIWHCTVPKAVRNSADLCHDSCCMQRHSGVKYRSEIRALRLTWFTEHVYHVARSCNHIYIKFKQKSGFMLYAFTKRVIRVNDVLL